MDQRSGGVHAVSTDHQFDTLISSGVRMVINCWAPWAAPCEQMNVVFQTLQKQSAARLADEAVDEVAPLLFAAIEPEKLPGSMKRFGIGTVPTFLFFANGRLVRRSSGADAALLSSNVRWLSDSSDATLLKAACDVVSTLGEVTLVMKGTADEPKCAFSRQAVQVLRTAGVLFETFNVLADEEVRGGMKERFDWATFPMVFVRGKLIGGIDILRELADKGKLVEELLKDGREEDVNEGQTEAAENGGDGKGDNANGEAGSEKGRAVVDGGGAGAPMEDEAADGLTASVRERLTGLVNRSEVMLFMKGSPAVPRCGFSRRIVEILREEGVQYEHFDILADNEVRQGLKKLWQWPTYPQLYARGKLIGGLDIVKELVQCGELKKELGG